MPEGHVHYAAESCVVCGRHIRWLPRPETIERRRLNGFRVARLVMCERLTRWEQHFVREVSLLKKLSPRQQAIVNELAATYLKGAAA